MPNITGTHDPEPVSAHYRYDDVVRNAMQPSAVKTPAPAMVDLDKLEEDEFGEDEGSEKNDEVRVPEDLPNRRE